MNLLFGMYGREGEREGKVKNSLRVIYSNYSKRILKYGYLWASHELK